MSGRRRLISSSRRTASSAPTAQNAATAELPPYEPPCCPLDDTAKRALAEISTNRENTRRYDAHLKQSVSLLKDSIGGINDRLHERQSELQALIERRRDKKQDTKTPQEDKAEEATEKLEGEVPDLTQQIEAAVRQVIDFRSELDDEQAAISALVDEVRSHQVRHPARNHQLGRRTRRGVAAEDDEDDDHAPAHDDDVPMDDASVISALEMLRTAKESKDAEYSNLSMHEKYGLNNDYIAFKKTWHDAEHPDDDAALPDASAWFDRHGNPVMSFHKTGGGDAMDDGEDEEDDDLVVAREIISFQCPLSLVTMTEPYSNNKCRHTFEKSAIIEFLRSGPKQCPQTGCSTELSAKDLYLDDVILRKIQRAQQAAQRGVGDTSDAEPDEYDGDASVIAGAGRNIKQERGKRSKRRIVEDVEVD